MDRLLIDVSSIMRAAHQVGKDLEHGYNVDFEGSKVYINSAEYCYDNTIVSVAHTYSTYGFTPRQTVLVLDGRDSRSLRRAIFPGYKDRPPRPPEMNKEFNAALDGVIDELTGLGALCVCQDGMEADDVLAYLAQNLAGEKTIWSRDGDMLALRRPDVNILLDKLYNPEAYANCPAELITLYKSLVGDSSDKFPGCPGFGAKSFTKLMMKYATELDDLDTLIKERALHELDLVEYPDLKLIVDNAASVYTSYACAKFYPERINTAQNPLEIKAQVVQVREEWHPAVARFAPTKKLFLPGDDRQALIKMLESSPETALDIETSTSPESDVWTDAINDSKSGNKGAPLDIMGSRLAGMSLTFGNNMQHTVYMPVDHIGDVPNWDSDQLLEIVEFLPEGASVLIHNTGFELPVLFNEWDGWLENAVDTMLMKSYVDENTSMGLKPSVKTYFGYQQVTYEQVTQKRGPVGTLPEGGKLVKAPNKEQIEKGAVELPKGWEIRQYKMNQLTAQETFDYACDDTICTAALANRLQFTMELEHTWEVFKQVEPPAQYWCAEAFVNGIDIDWARLAELAAEDDAAYEAPAKFVDDYLRSVNWRGCEYAPFEMTPNGVALAGWIMEGVSIKTSAKTQAGLTKAALKAGASVLAALLEAGDIESIDRLCQEHFVPKPDFDVAKDEHKRELFYEYLKLPIRFRTSLTDSQRAKGQKEGTPQTDSSSVEHFLKLDLDPESDEHRLLSCIREMDRINTRRELYYRPYPLLKHWKTGKVHPSLGQSKAATRRFTPNNPNVNQLPKKHEGKKVRTIVRAPKGYLVVSMDFSGQELRLAAERSQDQNLLSCYVGDNLRDPHTLTGLGIADKQKPGMFQDYADYAGAIKAEDPMAKAMRDTAKTVNFATQYLCMPPKLARTLVCPVADAGVFIDAKNTVYSGLKAWQDATIVASHRVGYTSTLMGARRHLYHKISDPRGFIVNEAERQGVNFEIQGSGGEMTKMSINAMWLNGVFDQYKAVFVMPVHDETVTLVPEDPAVLVPCLQKIHKYMIQQYSTMAVPLASEISIGDTFGTLVKVGMHPTEEAILKALEKVKENRNVV